MQKEIAKARATSSAYLTKKRSDEATKIDENVENANESKDESDDDDDDNDEKDAVSKYILFVFYPKG